MSYLTAHRQRVMHLYRHAMKGTLDWCGSRFEFYPRAQALRLEFEANRNADGRENIERLIEHGEALVKAWRHPDPLCRPYMPGGNTYSRDPPMPKEISIYLNFARENYDDKTEAAEWVKYLQAQQHLEEDHEPKHVEAHH